jgi:antitoxin VapB
MIGRTIRLYLRNIGGHLTTDSGRLVPMVLSIKSARADQLARDLAELTGESITEAVVASLEVRLELERRRRRERSVSDIVERFRQLPVLDDRDPDDIVGYDAHGLPS